MRDAAPNRWPAATASAALHAALLAAMLAAWFAHPIKLSSVVPITIVTADQASSQREAVAAPTPQTAATETPAPQAPPQAAAPAPPPPTPAPSPAKPAKAEPAPTPAKSAAKPTNSNFDPDAVLASLTKSTAAKQSSAKRGPPRAETALRAQTGAGAGDASSASALTSLAATLQRLWNPNCDVPGAGDLDIRVTFRLSPSGRLVGSPQSSGDSAPDSSLLRVASDRAKRAVYAAQPFDSLPPNLYGQPITVKFNGQSACASR